MSQADALVHVLDASAPDVRQQRAAVLRVLRQLGVGEAVLRRRTVEVWNKVDAVRVGGGGEECGDSGEGTGGDSGGLHSGGEGRGSCGEGAQRDGGCVAAGEVGSEGDGGRRRPAGMRHGVVEVAGEVAVQLDELSGRGDGGGRVRDRPGRQSKRTREKGRRGAELGMQVDGGGLGTEGCSAELEASRGSTVGLASGSVTQRRRRRLFQLEEEEGPGAGERDLDAAEGEEDNAGAVARDVGEDAGGEGGMEEVEEDRVHGGPSHGPAGWRGGCFADPYAADAGCASHSNGDGAETNRVHQQRQQQQQVQLQEQWQEEQQQQQQVGRPGEPGGRHGGVMSAGVDGGEDALWASKLRAAADVVQCVHGSGAGKRQGRGRGERDGEGEGEGGWLPAAVVLAAVGKGEGLEEVRWALAEVLQGRERDGRRHAGGNWRRKAPGGRAGGDGGALGCGVEQPSCSRRQRSEVPAKGQHGGAVQVANTGGREHAWGERASGTAGAPPVCEFGERMRGRWLTPMLWVSDTSLW